MYMYKLSQRNWLSSARKIGDKFKEEKERDTKSTRKPTQQTSQPSL